MSDPFLGEIRVFGFNFAPRNWALCNGQLVSIAQNTALFSLLGTNYGGDGRTTFGLPNLQGRAPMFWGQGPGLTNRVIGEASGSTTVTLLTSQMPAHTHVPQASSANGTANTPAGNVWAKGAAGRGSVLAFNTTPDVTMNAAAVGVAGGGGPHNNMPPYLAVNFCIALAGVFPSRN
jgi:microcystin-dependent protein